MPRWKTDEIVKLCNVKGVTRVSTQGPGGDYDTSEILVHFGGKNYPDGISVQGFVDFTLASTECLDETTIDEVDLDNVVVRTWGSDSDGGIQTTDEAILIASGRIRKALEAAGFSVWRHHDQLQ
jgi:hypothetical protein